MKLLEIFESLSDSELFVGDVFSIGVVVATLTSALPHVAAFLSVVWMLLRIWESDTVRELTNREKLKNRDDD